MRGGYSRALRTLLTTTELRPAQLEYLLYGQYHDSTFYANMSDYLLFCRSWDDARRPQSEYRADVLGRSVPDRRSRSWPYVGEDDFKQIHKPPSSSVIAGYLRRIRGDIQEPLHRSTYMWPCTTILKADATFKLASTMISQSIKTVSVIANAFGQVVAWGFSGAVNPFTPPPPSPPIHTPPSFPMLPTALHLLTTTDLAPSKWPFRTPPSFLVCRNP